MTLEDIKGIYSKMLLIIKDVKNVTGRKGFVNSFDIMDKKEYPIISDIVKDYLIKNKQGEFDFINLNDSKELYK